MRDDERTESRRPAGSADQDGPPVLTVVFEGGRPSAAAPLALGAEPLLVGRPGRGRTRLPERLTLEDAFVSRDHFRLWPPGAGGAFAGTWSVEDLGSKHGTRVDGRALPAGQRCPLDDGALITVGDSALLLREQIGLPAPVAAALPFRLGSVATCSGALVAVLERLQKLGAAGRPSPLLLLGETGVGKEVLARTAHASSPRRAGPFVAINCATLTPELADAQLFGHRRGAFTGAVRDQAGAFDQADGSTLFLDEIADLHPAVQAKLLRALDSGEVIPLGGGARAHHVDVQIIAATCVDLPARIAGDRFRPDLYARLAAVQLVVPPLRERLCDLGLLTAALLERGGASGLTFEAAALEALLAHDWPMNVRELAHRLERARMELAGTGGPAPGAVTREMLFPPGERGPERRSATAPSPRARPTRAGQPPLELEEALRLDEGNVRAAARRLGVTRKTVYGWLNRYGLDPDDYRARKPGRE
jgi:transcriptional regulator with AAA-type ATPase domain